MRALVREIAIYSVGAAAAFVVDIVVLWALVEIGAIHYLVAAAVGFIIGTAVLYGFSTRYAFAFRRIADNRHEFGLFAAVGLFGIALNLTIILGAVEVLHAHYLIAKVVASAVTFFANFVLRRALLFTPWHRNRTSASLGSAR
jgi:putative flippase GtrA